MKPTPRALNRTAGSVWPRFGSNPKVSAAFEAATFFPQSESERDKTGAGRTKTIAKLTARSARLRPRPSMNHIDYYFH
jgi:hypothetical protein